MLRFKLDENADPRWREPLVEAGHDVSTAVEESLEGVGDPRRRGSMKLVKSSRVGT